jgi:SOS-response transcriptional repressor LexA
MIDEGPWDIGNPEYYPAGYILTVDRTVYALPGDRIIVRLEDAREPIFRSFEKGEGKRTLMIRALNPQYPSIPLPSNTKVVVVVVGKTRQEWVCDRARVIADREVDRRAALAQ